MNQKQANDLIAQLNYRDATNATLTAALEVARGALESMERQFGEPIKSEARTALATIEAVLGRVSPRQT